MDDELREVLTKRFAAIRSRQRTAATEALTAVREEASSRGALRNSRYAVLLDDVAARQLDARVDEALAEARRLVRQLGLPWTREFGAALTSFLREEAAKDAHELRTLANDFGKSVGGSPIGAAVNASEQRAAEWIASEINLLVYSEALHRRPLMDQLSAGRYEAVREALSEARVKLDRDPSDPVQAAKAAVGAVEQLARIVTSRPTATLGQAIKTLRSEGRVPKPILKGMEELWGWASAEDGVRHGAAPADQMDEKACRLAVRSAEAVLAYLLELDGT